MQYNKVIKIAKIGHKVRVWMLREKTDTRIQKIDNIAEADLRLNSFDASKFYMSFAGRSKIHRKVELKT